MPQPPQKGLATATKLAGARYGWGSSLLPVKEKESAKPFPFHRCLCSYYITFVQEIVFKPAFRC